MKKFNQMTEEQMEGVHGGLAALVLCFLALVVAPAAVGTGVGAGLGVGLKNK